MDEPTRILATFNAYDQDDIALYTDALEMRCGMVDFYNELRARRKHGAHSAEYALALDWVWETLHESMPDGWND